VETEPLKIQPPPKSCPRCGGTRVVAILWSWCFLDGDAKDAIAAERAYLALSHCYFTSVDPTLVVGRFVAKESELPTWACLDCCPEWVAVHRLAESEWRVELGKEAACMAHDFERAAAVFHDLEQLEAAHVVKYERLLRELVALKARGSEGG
jgi:hypothetical protein